MSQSAPLNLGAVFPSFEAETTKGKMVFSEYIKDSWALICTHPKDYTPVCTTELGSLATFAPKFAEKGVKLAALSCDSVEDHKGWIKDIIAYNKLDYTEETFPYPIIADVSREIVCLLGMLDADEKDKDNVPLPARGVYIIGPDGKLKLSILYPATTGRSFPELLRVVESLQLTANNSVATPGNWASGERCMVVPSVKPEELESKFPKGVEIADLPSGKGYIRTTPDPRE